MYDLPGVLLNYCIDSLFLFMPRAMSELNNDSINSIVALIMMALLSSTFSHKLVLQVSVTCIMPAFD